MRVFRPSAQYKKYQIQDLIFKRCALVLSEWLTHLCLPEIDLSHIICGLFRDDDKQILTDYSPNAVNLLSSRYAYKHYFLYMLTLIITSRYLLNSLGVIL